MTVSRDFVHRAIVAYLNNPDDPAPRGELDGYARTIDGKHYIVVTAASGRPLRAYRLRNDFKLKRLRRCPAELMSDDQCQAVRQKVERTIRELLRVTAHLTGMDEERSEGMLKAFLDKHQGRRLEDLAMTWRIMLLKETPAEGEA